MEMYRKLKLILTAKERYQFLMLSILMFIGMVLEMLGIGLVIPAISFIIQPDIAEFSPKLARLLSSLGNLTQVELVIGGMLVLVGAYMLKTLFLIFMVWEQSKFIFGVQATLSGRLFSGYLNLPWAFHLQRNSSELIANATTEVNIFATSLQAFLLVLTEGFVLIGVSSLLFVIEPVGASIVVGVLGSSAFLFQYILRSRILNWGKSRQYGDRMRIQKLQQGIGGIKELKLLGREKEFYDQYKRPNKIFSIASQRQKTFLELPRLWIELLAVIGLAILILSMVAQDKALDSLIPILGLFAAAAFRIIPSLNRVLSSSQNLRYGIPVINLISKELALFKENETIKRNAKISFQDEILIQNLDYHYPNSNQDVLKNIKIKIKSGSSVGIIGASGAGKSTLIDIILGLITPSNGHIKSDGVNIQTNLRGWQGQIGYVPQSIYLTDDTLRNNIAFGVPENDIDSNAVNQAVKSAWLTDFISNLPNGLDTVVGERGVRLSGGQRQRIGIARALYHNPKILVLDEATSALDNETEKEVMKAVKLLKGKKTILIVAHRLSTIEHCDWVYRMSCGEVVDEGRLMDILDRQAKKTEPPKAMLDDIVK